MREKWRGWLLVVVVVVSVGCGSSSPPPAIQDPGGPFHTNVPSGASLGTLTTAQAQELCTEFAAADQSYLISATTAESTCRIAGLEGGGSPPSPSAPDGGADGGTFLSACQAAYDSCHQQLADNPGLTCIVPIAGCNATVELLSACLNEIANGDPIATCVTVPTCATAAATGSVAVSGVGPCSGVSDAAGPPLPACDRLWQQCPNVGVFDPY
jgi:hypothetical protein